MYAANAGVKRSGGDLDNATKRQNLGEPSKVLHVRGLPSYTTESEVLTQQPPANNNNSLNIF